MQEGVNGVRALHHYHVTSLLDDFEKCKQENLVAEEKLRKVLYYSRVKVFDRKNTSASLET